jgi:hypothetical protein
MAGSKESNNLVSMTSNESKIQILSKLTGKIKLETSRRSTCFSAFSARKLHQKNCELWQENSISDGKIKLIS